MSSDQYTSQDPTRQYKSPDTDGDQIDYPGQTGAMHDKPDHGENSYRGSHRLDDRAAVITRGGLRHRSGRRCCLRPRRR